MKLVNSIRSTFRIALIELNTMFYSPIAWLLLIIFAFQTGYIFSEKLDSYLKSMEMGRQLYSLSNGFFTYLGSVFPSVKQYIYLYIPLITMGLLSREYSSGSIKLLYSSPISSRSIVFGKFLAMAIYGAAITFILFIFVLFSGIVIDNFDWPSIMTGLLGIYLLLCTYSAIGLFMSSLTSYQVVAGIGTLALLAILNVMKNVGQGIEFVREITYWISLSGRVDGFIDGLISSENVVYFITVIGLFLSLTILKLSFERESKSIGIIVRRYVTVICITVSIGYLTTRPHFKFYKDNTFNQENTLSVESQNIMNRIQGPMKITTYVNLLDDNVYSGMPKNRTRDLERFERYLRFNPEISVKYVYYYDSTYNPKLYNRYPEKSNEEIGQTICKFNNMNFNMFKKASEINSPINLKSEGNRFLRVVEWQDKQAILRVFDDDMRHPDEAEIASAFRRLVDTLPRVAFLAGHGDRSINNFGSRGYKSFTNNLRFRYSLLNQGFDVEEVYLSKDKLSNDINILVITDLKTPLSDNELNIVNEYIANGGNLMILGDVGRQDNMNMITRPLGITFKDGIIVSPSNMNNASLIPSHFTPIAPELFPKFVFPAKYEYRLSMPGVVALDYKEINGFKVTPLFIADNKTSWIEQDIVDFNEYTPTVNNEKGEYIGEHVTYLMMSRDVGNKEQRIIVSGDADFLSNSELNMKRNYSKANFTVLTSAFRWLSNDKFPVYAQRAEKIDNVLKLPQGIRKPTKIIATTLIGGVLLILSFIVISRRKRK